MDEIQNNTVVTMTRIENGVAQLDSTMAAVHDVYINGYYKGNVTTSAKLILDKNAVYEGVIVARNCDIKGNFKGNISVKNTLSVMEGGKCSGTIQYGTLVTESGSVVLGKIEKMEDGTYENLLKEDKAYQSIFTK